MSQDTPRIITLDTYTKSVLTAIAILLGVIAAGQLAGQRAEAALGQSCGSGDNPCYVKVLQY